MENAEPGAGTVSLTSRFRLAKINNVDRMQAGLAPIDRHSERDEVSTIDYRVSTVDCRCGIGVRVRKLLDIILLSLLEVEVIESHS